PTILTLPSPPVGWVRTARILMTITEEQVRNALTQVKYPGFNRDIVSFGLVKQIVIHETEVGVIMNLTTQDAKVTPQIKADSEAAIRAIPGVTRAMVEMRV